MKVIMKTTLIRSVIKSVAQRPVNPHVAELDCNRKLIGISSTVMLIGYVHRCNQRSLTSPDLRHRRVIKTNTVCSHMRLSTELTAVLC